MNHTVLTELSGQIERITYNNLENGFTIAKMKVPGKQALAMEAARALQPCAT